VELGRVARRDPRGRHPSRIRAPVGLAVMVIALAISASGCGGKRFPWKELRRPALPTFPAPPVGAVVYSRRAGDHVLAVGVVPSSAGKAASIRVSVVGQQGRGVSGLNVHVDGRRTAACGRGCYERRLSAPQPRSLDVTVGGALSTEWRITLPHRWPPAPAAQLLRRAEVVWRRLKSVTITDRLRSDSRHVVVTKWREVAPDRVAYDVGGGGSAVIIGRRRWDRAASGNWQRSSQDPPLRQPVPFWVAVSDARVLGSVSRDGHPAWRISFYDPRTPAWFEVLLDKRTLRTIELRMNTTSHFMVDRYSAFDVTRSIRPPR
jgi:hypothetical protein